MSTNQLKNHFPAIPRHQKPSNHTIHKSIPQKSRDLRLKLSRARPFGLVPWVQASCLKLTFCDPPGNPCGPNLPPNLDPSMCKVYNCLQVDPARDPVLESLLERLCFRVAPSPPGGGSPRPPKTTPKTEPKVMPEGTPPKSYMFPPGGSKNPRAPPDRNPESGPERNRADQKT